MLSSYLSSRLDRGIVQPTGHYFGAHQLRLVLGFSHLSRSLRSTETLLPCILNPLRTFNGTSRETSYTSNNTYSEAAAKEKKDLDRDDEGRQLDWGIRQ